MARNGSWVPLYYPGDELVDRLRETWGEHGHAVVEVAPWDTAAEVEKGKRVAFSTAHCREEARVVFCVIKECWPEGEPVEGAGGVWTPMNLVVESRPVMELPS